MSETNVTSPFAAGGGGSDFERRVGAYYLATVLVGATPRGQKSGAAREVRLQRRHEGQPLDDLIVVSRLPASEALLALQIKRDLTFGREDPTFQDVMRDCWATFTSSRFQRNRDQLGIALGLYSKKIDEHYQPVLSWARASARADDFLQRIAQDGLSNQTMRSFVALFREMLAAIAGRPIEDQELWEFFKCFLLIRFDLHNQDSSDSLYAIHSLVTVLPPDRRADAPRLFTELAEIAALGNRTAGSFDATALRQLLTQAGFCLLAEGSLLVPPPGLRFPGGNR